MKTANELLREKRVAEPSEKLDEASVTLKEVPADPNWGSFGDSPYWVASVAGGQIGSVEQDPKTGKFRAKMSSLGKTFPPRKSKELAAKDLQGAYQAAAKEAKSLAKSLDISWRKMRGSLPTQKHDEILRALQGLYDALDGLES